MPNQVIILFNSNIAEFPYSTINQETGQKKQAPGGYQSYNKFENTSNVRQPTGQMYQQYNQFNNLQTNYPNMAQPQPIPVSNNPNPNQNTQPQVSLDKMDEDSIGEFIYNTVERLYPG
jgi:hypothetical protein